jgi:hypothetical protein
MSALATRPAGGTSAPMYARGHYWRVHLPDGRTVDSDDFTLDDVERIETLTDVAWATMNPLASLKQAKAFLLVAALHAGATEQQATELLAGLNLRGIKGAFQLHSGDAGHLRDVLGDTGGGTDSDVDELPPVPPS